MGFLGKKTAIAPRCCAENDWIMDPIRIYLIDDQAMIRWALQALLETDGSFMVVGFSGHGPAGADGYVSKDSEPDELCLAIAAIHRGDSHPSPRLASRSRCCSSRF